MKLYQFDRIQYGIHAFVIVADGKQHALDILSSKEKLGIIDYNKTKDNQYIVRLGDSEIIEIYDLTIHDLETGLKFEIIEE